MNQPRFSNSPAYIYERNFENGQHSRGPTTERGKMISRCNSLQHGLRANPASGVVESPEEFDALLDQLHDEMRPAGVIEIQAVHSIAVSIWRLQRAAKIDAATCDAHLSSIGRREIDPQEIRKWVNRINNAWRLERVQETTYEWRRRTGLTRQPRREEKKWRYQRPDLHGIDDLREEQMMDSPAAIEAMMVMLRHMAEKVNHGDTPTRRGLVNSNDDGFGSGTLIRMTNQISKSNGQLGTQDLAFNHGFGSGTLIQSSIDNHQSPGAHLAKEEDRSLTVAARARFSADEKEKLAWLLGDFARRFGKEEEVYHKGHEGHEGCEDAGQDARPTSDIKVARPAPGTPKIEVVGKNPWAPRDFKDVEAAGNARPAPVIPDTPAMGHRELIDLMTQEERDEETEQAFARTVENRLSCLEQQLEIATPPEIVDEDELYQQRLIGMLSADALFEKKMKYERQADLALNRALRRIRENRKTEEFSHKGAKPLRRGERD